MNLYQVDIKREFAEDNNSVLVVANDGQEAEAMVRKGYGLKEWSDDYDVLYITKITEVCGYGILLVPKKNNRELCYA